MQKKRGRKVFSLNYLFASFFGALMIASAFAYYNYKFSQYKFFDFNEYIFYSKKDIFTPKRDIYTVIVYSSNMVELKKLTKKIKQDNSILAIDLYQQRFQKSKNITPISSGMNTLLKFIQRFNIYEVPCAFRIKKVNNNRYKQDSLIEILTIGG